MGPGALAILHLAETLEASVSELRNVPRFSIARRRLQEEVLSEIEGTSREIDVLLREGRGQLRANSIPGVDQGLVARLRDSFRPSELLDHREDPRVQEFAEATELLEHALGWPAEKTPSVHSVRTMSERSRSAGGHQEPIRAVPVGFGVTALEIPVPHLPTCAFADPLRCRTADPVLQAPHASMDKMVDALKTDLAAEVAVVRIVVGSARFPMSLQLAQSLDWWDFFDSVHMRSRARGIVQVTEELVDLTVDDVQLGDDTWPEVREALRAEDQICGVKRPKLGNTSSTAKSRWWRLFAGLSVVLVVGLVLVEAVTNPDAGPIGQRVDFEVYCHHREGAPSTVYSWVTDADAKPVEDLQVSAGLSVTLEVQRQGSVGDEQLAAWSERLREDIHFRNAAETIEHVQNLRDAYQQMSCYQGPKSCSTTLSGTDLPFLNGLTGPRLDVARKRAKGLLLEAGLTYALRSCGAKHTGNGRARDSRRYCRYAPPGAVQHLRENVEGLVRDLGSARALTVLGGLMAMNPRTVGRAMAFVLLQTEAAGWHGRRVLDTLNIDDPDRRRLESSLYRHADAPGKIRGAGAVAPDAAVAAGALGASFLPAFLLPAGVAAILLASARSLALSRAPPLALRTDAHGLPDRA